MRIVYRDLPDLLDPAIREMVDRWAPVLPSWMHTLTVTYDDTDADNYASTSPLYEQRVAVVAIHPLFWSLDACSREATLLHEFGHILTAPLDALFESIADGCLKGGELLRAHEAYRRESEGVVTDIAGALQAVA